MNNADEEPYKLEKWDETDSEDLSLDQCKTQEFMKNQQRVRRIQKAVQGKKYQHLFRDNQNYFKNLLSTILPLNSSPKITIRRQVCQPASAEEDQALVDTEPAIHGQKCLQVPQRLQIL